MTMTQTVPPAPASVTIGGGYREVPTIPMPTPNIDASLDATQDCLEHCVISTQPDSIQAALDLAGFLVQAKLAASGVTVEQTAGRILYGQRLGFTWQQSLTAVYVVNGRPALESAYAKMLFEKAGHTIRVTRNPDHRSKYPEELGQQYCQLEIHRADWPAERIETVEFHYAEAKEMGLLKNNGWQKVPRRMLVWRAISKAMDLYGTDVLMGFGVGLEAEDTEPTPAPKEAATDPTVQMLKNALENSQAETHASKPADSADAPVTPWSLIRETITEACGGDVDRVNAAMGKAGFTDGQAEASDAQAAKARRIVKRERLVTNVARLRTDCAEAGLEAAKLPKEHDKPTQAQLEGAIREMERLLSEATQ